MPRSGKCRDRKMNEIVTANKSRVVTAHGISNINDRLVKAGVNEDKLMGPFFLSGSELTSTESLEQALKEKVFSYLYDDAAKMYRNEIPGFDAGKGFSANMENFLEAVKNQHGFKS